MDGIALRMAGINKSFAGVPVLKDVSFELRTGEVHALLGQNGAGKSSLMKILMGIYQPDSGEYVVGGKPVRFSSPADAQRTRVSMVYQEFGLVQYLDVTENILLGRLPTRWGKVDWRAARARAGETLRRLGSKVSPQAIVGDLKVADQQEVEIARALSYDPLVFVMDEPSSALSRVEIDNLYGLVRLLKKEGVNIVYISHKLEDVFALADRVSILRDGAMVGTYGIHELDMTTLVERMTGKTVSTDTNSRSIRNADADSLLEVEGLSAEGLFEDVSFKVGKGIIVGVAGVIGAGKSELARSLVGALGEGTRLEGRVSFEGKPIDLPTMTPNKARSLGIALLSEDRQSEGLVHDQPVKFNIVLPALDRVVVAFTISRRKVRDLVLRLMTDVSLRPREPDKLVRLLSGGNQQKVVIAKWLAAQSKLLILDEPTRGIDVGAREEIYNVIRRQAVEHGRGVLLLSSDLREILLVSDEILIMVQGRIKGIVRPSDVTERALLDMVVVRSIPAEAPVAPAK